MYVDSTYFYTIYPDLQTEGVYEKGCYNAQMYIDDETMTLDGVRKLKEAFPTDTDDVERVKRCWCELCKAAYLVDKEKDAIASASSLTEIGGRIAPSIVTSISSGSESISFGGTNASNYESEYTKAAKSSEGLTALIRSITRMYLAGIRDANGVNLLYRGLYPYCV